MTINELFQKDINRQIEGVIKADDTKMILTELEEYVITSENETNLTRFLEAYNNYNGGNGVWISGFFGSGKSHLLKMLSIVLENKLVKGRNALEIFTEKTDDQFLKAELKKAGHKPTENILFNIDQKADVISSKQADAVLKVFLKVFNEHCGYFGKQPYIAKFERDLDKRGMLVSFKEEFRKQAGIDWEEGREQIEFEAESLAQAYGTVTGNDPEKSADIIERYREKFTLSIEDFADMVKNYIDSKEEGFRLNFFVDEVGQYIAGETKLMTNLQTIAESLNTKCRGRSWLVVTAQEDMDTVIGDVGGQQSNDFSKIQDRFKIRMKLTSRDVAEVIQKRLLKKKESAGQILSQRYDQEKNNFSTLFSFSDGTKTYKNFKDQEDFIDTYPFIPYQYELFQSSIQELSDHNALEGKHSSVGERSMLGVFQKVVQTIENKQIGRLATFDKMFEGIKNALKSSIQQAIISAERNIGNETPLAVKLLKILLLVKYIQQFKSTPENLTTLLIDDFNVNLKKLREDVQTALNRLESETYIQKAGDQYEYLTDEEKDVEWEIKHTDCPQSEIERELEKKLFEEIFVERKIEFRKNRQPFTINRKVDGQLVGKENGEVSLNVITPLNEDAGEPDRITMKSAGNNRDMLICLEPDDTVIKDLKKTIQTARYTQNNLHNTENPNVKRIISEKYDINQQRDQKIRDRLKELLNNADIYIAGNRVKVQGSTPAERITEAFQQLVRTVFTNHAMIGQHNFTEQATRELLTRTPLNLPAIPEAESEVNYYIKRQQKAGMKVTFKNVIDHFEKIPYGWPLSAITYLVALLYKKGKIEIKTDSNSLENGEVLETLQNSRAYANTILRIEEEITGKELSNLKAFYKEYFSNHPKANEGKKIAIEIKDDLVKEAGTLKEMRENNPEFHFIHKLKEPEEKIKKVAGKDPVKIIKNLDEFEGDLLEEKVETIDPIKDFMHSQKREIYIQSKRFLEKHTQNLERLDGNIRERMEAILNDERIFRKNEIPTLKDLLNEAQEKITHLLDSNKQKAKQTIYKYREKLEKEDGFGALKQDQKEKLYSEIEKNIEKLNDCDGVAYVKEHVDYFTETTFNRLLNEKNKMLNENTAVNTKVTSPVKTVENFSLSRYVKNKTESTTLKSKADIKQFTEELKQALLEKISEEKEIYLI